MSDIKKPNRSNVRGIGSKKREDLSDYVFGKVQPQAVPLEEAILGAIMLDKDALPIVLDIIQVKSFYTEAHQHIYQAMRNLFDRSQPIDLLTVTEELRKTATLEMVGGPAYLVTLTNKIASAANIEYHARIISQKAIQRDLITVSTKIIRDAYEDTTDVFNLLDEAEQGLFNITQQNMNQGFQHMGKLAATVMTQLEELSQKEEGLTGVPTGFTELDRLTSGWQKSDLIIIAARPGMGKCLGKGTKVLMYDGQLKKVEDVITGDLLMGDDSTPRMVKSIARGREKMYWVRQNKGIDYRVNESHILSLKRSRTEGPHKNGDVLNITVSDYLTKSTKFKSNYKGYKVAVEFKNQEVTLPPYFMGIWLGDGTSAKSQISTTDEEVLTYLDGYATTLGLELKVYHKDAKKCPQYTISGGYTGNKGYSLQRSLREIGVLNNKHIPQNYLINSTQKRLELLAGLIDSDGHYLVQSNGFEIAQKNETLAKQIKFLCDSLGFSVSLKKKKANIASIGYETEVHRLRIYGDIEKIPVKIKRKQANPWKSPVNWKATGIQVEYDKVDDYYGFEIDGNRLFLLQDMTVTHNTAFTLSLARNAAVDYEKPIAFFSLEMSNTQLVQRILSSEAEIPSSKLRTGQLEDYEWQQLNSTIKKIGEAPIFIDDTPGINIFELRAKCRRLKMKHDIQMIIIDYLQLMTGGPDNKNGNREQEISNISRSLKGLAKELNVPVIALSQLSRAVEVRGGAKRPQLSDLRECIAGDSLIYMPDSGIYKRVDELVGQQNFNVLALDENYKLQTAKCLDVWETGEKEIYEVETQSGFKIRTSLNHPFYTIDGWQQLVDLKEGDYVATSRVTKSTSKSNLKNEEIILLAHMIGDGCFVARQPIHNTSEEQASLEIVSACAKKLWGIKPRLEKDKNSKNCFQLYLPSPYHLTHGVKHPFSILIDRLGLAKSRAKNKVIPNAIFSSSLKQVALFIQHLWSTDGGIHIRNDKGASKLHYSSNSIRLIDQLKSLLLRFGIHSNISKARKGNYDPNYNLNITGKENILRFAKQIDIFGSKSLKLAELVQKFKTVKHNPNSDIIPKNIWNNVRTLKSNKGFTERSFQAALETNYCGSTLYKSNLSRERLERVATILSDDNLDQLANSDIKWEKIKSITHIGNEMTYDLHVEGLHNFVSNNFIVHNSGAIEQDADIVSFIYRPEYYSIMEDEEGNSLKGITEIIVAKHRNGSLNTVNLKFIPQFTKFADVDTVGFDDLGSDFPAGGGSSITVSSKMNETDEDVPF